MSVNALAGPVEDHAPALGTDEHAVTVVAAAIGEALTVVVNLDAPATETGGGEQEGNEAGRGGVGEAGGEVETGGKYLEDRDNLEDRYVFMSTGEALERGLPRGERIRPSPGSLTSSYHGQTGRGTAASDEVSGISVAPSEGLWLSKVGDPARTLGLNLPWKKKRRWFILR